MVSISTPSFPANCPITNGGPVDARQRGLKSPRPILGMRGKVEAAQICLGMNRYDSLCSLPVWLHSKDENHEPLI
jgi:hypothetical protein